MPAADRDVRDVLIEAWAVNGRMNRLLLEGLDPRAWRAKADDADGGRTIAAIFVHMHNARVTWLRLAAPHLRLPEPLDPVRATLQQAAAAHRRSTAECLRMLKDALSDSPGRRVKRFPRDGWGRAWPAGATTFLYMFAHEAHHRGQILFLAHQLGFRLDQSACNIWQWDRLWKEAGLKTLPR